MARERVAKTISFDPANPDALAVLAALENVSGAHSSAILRWAAAYLRGEAAQATTPPADDDSALDDALDSL